MPAASAWGRSVGGPARERVATAQRRILELRRTRDQEAYAAREAIRTKTVGNLLILDDGSEQMVTEQQLEERRDYAAKQVRDRYASQLTELQQQITDDRETLQRVAEETRPNLPDDAQAQQRALATWEHKVKPQLEANMLPSQILAGADVATALALAEWGPAWLQAQAYADRPAGMAGLAWEPPDNASLARAVDARLAELDQDYAAYRTAAVEAERVAAATEPVLAHDAGTSRGTGLEAALAGHYAGQAVTIEHGMAAADSTDGAAGEGAA